MKLWIHVVNLFLIAGLAFTAGFTLNDVKTAEIPAQIAVPVTGNAIERLSPSDWIKEDQIKVYKDRIVIEVDDAIWARFADTGSMDPVLDAGTNGLEIKIDDPSKLRIGDIVSYKSTLTEGIIIHRIVFIGEDKDGRYFVMKGDNLPSNDPEKVRDEQLQYVLVGLLY